VPTHDQDNPFAPPKAAVLAAEATDGTYIPDGQRVATSRGSEWFGEAWRLFTASPGTWVAIFVIFIVTWTLLAIVPGGSLLSSLCYPAVAAGLMMGCKSLEEGGEIRIGNLFTGFQQNVGNLLLVGILYLVGGVVITIVAVVVALVVIPLVASGANLNNFNVADWSSMLVLAPAILLVLLVVLTLTLPLFMAMWFAPALVVFHEVPPMAAMRSSFHGCLKNAMPFLVYGVVGLLLFIVALIPLGLGLLVFGPVIWGTMYVGYRDIFVRRA
jgi:hypothetical protein